MDEYKVDQGWFLARIGRVEVVYIDEHMTSDSFERYFQAFIEVTEGGLDEGIGVVYESPQAWAMSATERRRFARALRERQAILKKRVAAFSLVTGSPLVRGLLTAVFWVAPPPYPYRVTASVSEAFRFVQRHVPECHADDAERAYIELKKVLLPRTR